MTSEDEVARLLDILDVIDGIVDETHPEGDGCPLCGALDDLRAALSGVPEGAASDPMKVTHRCPACGRPTHTVGVPEGAASERPGGAECLFTGGHLWESEPGGRCLKCSPPRSVPSPEPLDVEEVARRIHRSKDGCNGRPHTRWFRGPNKCLRLARLAAPQPVPANLVCGRDGCEFEVEMGEGRDLALHASDEDHQPWHPAPQPVPEDET